MKKERSSSTLLLGQFREAFYLLLSRSFSREPDQEMLRSAQQVSSGLLDAWETMELPSPDMQEGKILLERFFSELSQKDIEETIEQLARKYASLFLGVGPKGVSLCESFYRSSLGLLYQSAMLEVQQVYQDVGMAKSDQYREPDDHISVELGYMARLCAMSREVVETGAKGRTEAVRYLTLQKTFLEGHLLQWVPQMSRNLSVAAASGFYRAVAHLVNGYIGIDGRLIDSMIEELNEKPRRRKGSEKVRKVIS